MSEEPHKAEDLPLPGGSFQLFITRLHFQGMLSLGRALMGMPQLMILDEPSLGLQPNLVEKMFEMTRMINEEWGTTILLAEQNARKTLEIANSGYVLQKGRIIGQGSTQELMNMDIIKKAYLSYTD